MTIRAPASPRVVIAMRHGRHVGDGRAGRSLDETAALDTVGEGAGEGVSGASVPHASDARATTAGAKVPSLRAGGISRCVTRSLIFYNISAKIQ